jgi:uncharacterized damage-inducible protein DinB
MGTENEKLEALIIQFDLHQRLFNNVLDGFTDEETNHRLPGYPHISHVKYIAGHLLNSQYGIAKIAGLDPEVKWNHLFAVMGQSEAKDDIDYPSIKDIKTVWNGMYEEIRTGLMNLSAEELNRKPPDPFNRVANSVGELWAFISHHQAYHIGQIGLLRRAFGKEPMSFQ